MTKSSLLVGGEHYNLLINWDKRLSIEMPFLMDFIKDIKPSVKTILDLGCGTGHHTQILQKKYGYQVTGVDIDQSMIEEARKQVPNAELLVQDFMDPEALTGRLFDAIISLGNSVGLIGAAHNGFKGIISKFFQVLRKSHGILIFHLLNTEKEREGWSPPRSVVTDNGEYIFLRGFTTTEKFIHPEIITLFQSQDNKEWEMITTGKTNIPRISYKSMVSLLQEVGFTDVRVFGDYNKSPFDPLSSVDMITIGYT
ncbi:MAG: class I SAM-dependent methyltransferase [Candidatus Heimdallarchaeota archaeon]|nr:MAG: class I SAM-dependent methyltransferase [Candidatus Heimdallarchaeota archaeon]